MTSRSFSRRAKTLFSTYDGWNTYTLGTLPLSLFQNFISIMPALPLVLAFYGFLLLIMSTKVNLFQLLKSTKKDIVKRTVDRGTCTQIQASEMQASEKLPTYEEIPKASKKNVMDKLEEEITKAQKPEDLLVHLLSTELNIADKEALLQRAPMCIFVDSDNHRESAEKVEAQLENAGYGKLAIFLYWCFFWDEVQPKGSESWIKELIEIDIEGRWISQRKACIQQKVQGLQISSELLLSSEDEAKYASQLEIYKEQLKDLNKRHWALCRKKWIKEGSIKSWSFNRAYRRQRACPDWYLSASLCDDCAGRGGCCGRSCGCCERPRTVDGFEDTINTRGHCTTACGCCLKAHGVEDLDVGINGDIPDLQELCFKYTTPSLMEDHSLRLLMGYAFDFSGLK